TVADEALNEEKLPTQSIDPPLSIVNTLRSGEDRLKLNILMKLCTKLSDKVLNLETTKTSQAQEISVLKRKVKRLQKKRRSKSSWIEKGRTNNDEMFGVDDLAREEVVMDTTTSEHEDQIIKDVSPAEPVTTASKVVTTTTTVKDSADPTTCVTEDEITMAQALVALKSTKPKVMVQEQEMSTTIPVAATTVTTVVTTPRAISIVFHEQKQSQIPNVFSSNDKGKAKMIEPKVPIKKKDQLRIDEEYAKKLEAKEQEAARLSRAQQDEKANILCDNTQAMMEADTLTMLQSTSRPSLLKFLSVLLKVKRKGGPRAHGLKRLYKVGLSARVKSSAEEESLDEEDASKQGKISDIDTNQDIYMVNVHRDEDIFGVNDQDDTSMFDAHKDLQGEEVIVEEVDVASIATAITAAATTAISFDELTMAQALVEIKASRPKEKGIVMQEPNPLKMKKKDQISFDEQEARILQAEIDEQDRLAVKEAQKELEANNAVTKNGMIFKLKLIQTVNWLKESSSKRAGDELEQESAKKQKVDDDQEAAKRKRCLEIVPDNGDEATIDATLLSSKSPTIMDYKIYKEGRKSYFQIIRVDDSSQMYLTFSKTLKNFNKEGLEVLWSIVKARFKKVQPVNLLDNILFQNLKTMCEHHVEDNI
nr:hypothetical protein [Tanacetum cinerariifolium]